MKMPVRPAPEECVEFEARAALRLMEISQLTYLHGRLMQTRQTRVCILFFIREELQDIKVARATTFSYIQLLRSETMDEEDDYFYDPADAVPIAQTPNDTQKPPANAQSHETNEEEEEVEIEDDDVGFAEKSS